MGSPNPSLVTPEGQNVITIIAPSSPAESVTTTIASTCDSDPEWTPSPDPVSPAQLSLLSRKPEQTKTRKKYARSKPPSPPCVAPYPVDKKELEALTDRNGQLQEKLVQMETEFKYLKKLMVEA